MEESEMKLSADQIAGMVDHTNLKAFADEAMFEKLCSEAREYGFKMVAINPAQTERCKRLLEGCPVHVGAAIGFPLGQTTLECKVFETKDAIEKGADEIDYVINIAELKNKNYDYIKKEMEEIGLSRVTKDEITVDGWEFRKAVLYVLDENGKKREIRLGAYQTNCVTDGAEEYPLVYVGKGTELDYKDIDVKNKLVLVDINQRDEWWINFPVYQAHLKGAKALIAVQQGGYGEIDEDALNAQDIAGPADAPAFSISRRDAQWLKEQLDNQQSRELWVTLEADSRVMPECKTYNITGQIQGKHKDRLIVLSAHYDSYFDGFQDDNTAVAMMFGIAKALIDARIQPDNTILICAMAAEEWGVIDSDFDWSTGAYEQVFTAHPEWVGKVIADLNFELPALAHGAGARIRSCYEYQPFLEQFLEDLPVLTRAYPEDASVVSPIETWSDDFSMAIAGIPSMVNDFTGGSFMETHYHSQFDNDEYYDPQVYQFHHELYALLILAIDATAVVPLSFTGVMKRAQEGLELVKSCENSCLEEKYETISKLLTGAEKQQEENYRWIMQKNSAYKACEDPEQRETLYQSLRQTETELLKRFKTEQDAFVRIDWYGNVFYPHEILLRNIHLLEGAKKNLEEGELSVALRKLYDVDNNAYAFMFDKEVYRHFTDYVYHQPKERLKWGYRRLMQHENLYDLVKQLLKKEEAGEKDCREEAAALAKVIDKQYKMAEQTMEEIYQTVKEHFVHPIQEQ